MICLRSVSKTVGRPGFRRPALVEVSAVFETARRYVILGADGAGKTTLMRILGGLVQPTEGTVRREGRVLPPLGSAASIDGAKTALQLLRLMARLYDADFDEVRRFVVEFGGLGDVLDVPIGALPARLRSRLSFAVGYAVPCEFLLVDEAIGYGDPAFRAACREAFELRRRQAATIVALKDSRFAHDLGDVGGVLRDGRLVMYDTVEAAVDAYRAQEAANGSLASGANLAPPDPLEVERARLVSSAQAALREERNRDALDLAARALEVSPGDRDALLVMATAAQKLGLDDVSADANVRLAAGTDGNNLRIAVRNYMRAGRWSEMLAAVEGTRGVEDSAFLLSLKARALGELGRWDEMGDVVAKLGEAGVDKALEAMVPLVKSEGVEALPAMVGRFPRQILAGARDARVVDLLQAALLRMAATRIGEGDAQNADRFLDAAVVLGPTSERIGPIAARRAAMVHGPEGGGGRTGVEPGP